MKIIKHGNTGLEVSRICLGTMSFGGNGVPGFEWTVDEAASRTIFRQAVEAGINFFDTANAYSAGESEVIVGKLLKEFTRRDEAVVATKVYFPVDSQAPNRVGLSRKAIFSEIDASLKRLDVDYVDLYQTHRWDATTPIEETMEALHDVVKAGKARYIGASSMYAWQFAKAQSVARANGWTPFVSMQNSINLIYREEEREMVPLCLDQGVGIIPWSPLARGRLARPQSAEQTSRGVHDVFTEMLYAGNEAADARIIAAVEAIAKERSVGMASVALAWLLSKKGVTAPIVGVTREQQLSDAIAAVDLELTDAEIAQLENNYTPRNVSGFM